MNRSVLIATVGQVVGWSYLPLYPTTVFTTSNLFDASVNVGVILRKLYRIGFADGGLSVDLARSKSHSIESVLVVRQTPTRADVYSVWLGQNGLAAQTGSTIVASTCGNALRRAFCRFTVRETERSKRFNDRRADVQMLCLHFLRWRAIMQTHRQRVLDRNRARDAIRRITKR
ncbi:hypothetical protein MFFC18_21300 [Mariniblastus fucicola]|uniref:Uncharacterized protein n=1 Tax=Mariniblastus fucicola TaxID=980251 RepID=A0A5B9P7E7_9BACT|nr:hypothetical protein MFFC18_21300 [Mariniblastus fucicola]